MLAWITQNKPKPIWIALGKHSIDAHGNEEGSKDAGEAARDSFNIIADRAG